MTDRHLGRIAALLRKAESTENEHEADAFLQAAQRLATAASIDLAIARAHTSVKERRTTPVQRTVEIGEPGKRGLRTYVQLFLVIGRANDLTCDIARDSTRVFAYGFESDIDTAEALYASLVVQMVRSCDAYLKSGDHRAELVHQRVIIEGPYGRRVRTEFKPVHTTTARINFQQAFAARIGRRLAEAAAQAQAQAAAHQTPAGSPTGDQPSLAMVLRAKEIELADHYRTHSQARGSWGGFRSTGATSLRAGRAGDQAGRTARLGGEKEIGGARQQIPR